MSWMKRRSQASPAPTAGVPLYNPNQHALQQPQQQQWQSVGLQAAPIDQSYNNWYNPAQQQVVSEPQSFPPYSQPAQPWPQQQSNYNSAPPPPSQYQTQNIQKPNSFPQQNPQSHFYQQSNYQTMPQQNYTQPHPPTYNTSNVQQPGAQFSNQENQNSNDPWNWGWGDDTNSNVPSEPVQNVDNSHIGESFTSNDTWNWSVESNASNSATKTEVNQMAESFAQVEHQQPVFQKMVKQPNNNETAEIKGDLLSFGDNEQSQEKTATPSQQISSSHIGRRGHIDMLTPQWSIESQVSQDSSDDPLHTSESDNRSNKLSRSSTISQCPSLSASNHDVESINPYNQHLDHENRYSNDKNACNLQEATNHFPYVESGNIRSQIAEVSSAIEALTLQHNTENKEILVAEAGSSRNSQTQPSSTETNPPLPKNMSPPILPPRNTMEGPPVNIYKRTGNVRNYVYSNENYSDQSISNYVPENKVPMENLGVNMETVPDNAERPDQFPLEVPRSTMPNSRLITPGTSTVHQAWLPVENLEVAPRNDRNQYLETGQLSDSDLPETNFSQNLLDSNTEEPPPGLSRMVLGRTETELNISNSSVNEPRILTGLDRVVDGQPENIPNQQVSSGTNDDLPVGLHRMVPGESSSPETNTRWTIPETSYYRSNYDDDDTEAELQALGGNIIQRPTQRSETIGADTPPTSSAQNLLATDSSVARDSAIGRDSLSPASRETNLEGAATQEQATTLQLSDTAIKSRNNSSDNMRLETIDGGPQIPNIQSTVRSQTDGENTTDLNQGKEPVSRGRTHSDSSDDDRDPSSDRRRNKSPMRYEKDRKYYDRRDRESPDRYRDRKSDRRRYRDRYYEDDTDYYSDKDRRDRRPRDPRDREDYDRKYNSLQRDKDRPEKPRGSRDRRDYERDGRRDDFYYRRYEDDYYGRESRGSRPSSRSDSYRDHRMHDARDPRKMRDQYESYYQNYGYENFNPYYSAHYQQHYQYYENLRRTNPAAYAEWYRKFFQNASAHMGMQGVGHDDRASVHSGRSSANEDKDRYSRHSYYPSQPSTPHMGPYYSQPPLSYSQEDSRVLDQTDSSLNLDDATTSQRLTPVKFATAHVKASISSGHLIRILPNYPLDGQAAIVEVLDLQTVLKNDPEQQELSEFPGPLSKNHSHKKTIIDYCEAKIKRAYSNSHINDKESYILMWDLLILLLRQNGVVVGTDIAELLMKNVSSSVENSRRGSVVSSVGSVLDDPPHLDTNSEVNSVPPKHNKPALSEAFVTNKFREYLLYGSGKEALEWAMKNGLWGHALFLASKLDKRTYANVMMRFANGLTINDPLQTLYQLLSGRQPAAVTCVSDEKWGDWRPHLAMILSNTSQRPELDRKAITTLGDTLYARGSLYAAHFCYLMAQTGFGRYDSKSARLVLLGSSHQKPFTEFANNEAIIMTEIYEYACSLSDTHYNIPELQHYKYLLACRYVDVGFSERALLYMERIGTAITQNPSRYGPFFTNKVLSLGERLRVRESAALADLQLDPTQDDADPKQTPDISWITDLKAILSDYDMGLVTHDAQSMSNLASSELDIAQSITPPTDLNPSEIPSQTTETAAWSQPVTQTEDLYQPNESQQWQQNYQSWQSEPQSNDFQTSQQSTIYQQSPQSNSEYDLSRGDNYMNQPEQSQYWNQQQQPWESDAGAAPSTQSYTQQSTEYNSNQDYWNSTAPNELEPVVEEKPEIDNSSPPQISMPNSSTSNFGYMDDEDKSKPTSSPGKSAPKTQPKKEDKPAANNSGWFGGIWNKLSLRPKNQMKLPDDKNPTIVWDSKKNKWVNLDEDGEEVSETVKPPPKMADLYPQVGKAPKSLPEMNPKANGSVPTLNQMSHEPPNVNNQTFANPEPIVESNGPKPPSQSNNMFKLQRGRGVKKAYIDVFNPNGTASGPRSLPDAANVFGANAIPTMPSQVNYFVPKPVNDPNASTDFLMPSAGVDQPPHESDNPQLSRWSSASSLSREVQHFMLRPKQRHTKPNAPQAPNPSMYNPNHYPGSQQRGQY